MKNKNIHVIACSIFKDELMALMQNGEFKFDMHFYSSMLHMNPLVLENTLSKDFNNVKTEILLIYGDCCPNMESFTKNNNVSRTYGVNCIEIILGKETYKRLRSERVFFLMPEWLHRWKEIFNNQFHMNRKITQEFMQDFHSKIIYIDTGFKEIPENLIEEIGEFTGLKVEILKSGTKNLNNSIKNALNKFND